MGNRFEKMATEVKGPTAPCLEIKIIWFGDLFMNAKQVRSRVEKELEVDWRGQEVNGIVLGNSVIEPYTINIVDVFKNSEPHQVWVVFAERPNEQAGFIVIYDEKHDRFGLAEHAPEGPPYLIAFHDGFLKAVRAM